MLAGISGIVQKKDDESLILQAGPVSFQVLCPLPVLQNATENKACTLVTHLHVREDALTLFGFETEEGLALFRLLVSVSGIGPKTALEILSAGESAIQNAIASENVSFLTSIKGIGKKTAERTILELKEKIQTIPGEISLNSEKTSSPETEEAILALENLGWKKKDILTHLKKAPEGLHQAEEIIRWFLTNNQ